MASKRLKQAPSVYAGLIEMELFEVASSAENFVSKDEQAAAEESPKPPRKKKQESQMWLHFEKLDNKFAKCNHCHGRYSHHGNTSNLRKHLLHHHPLIYHSEISQSATAADADDVTVAQQRTVKPRRPRVATSDGDAQRRINMETFFGREFARENATYKHFMQHVQQFFVENCLPFDVVESDSFRRLIDFLNNKFMPPTRKDLTLSMDGVFARMIAKYKVELQLPDHFSVTIDTWTDRPNAISYLSVTIHYVVEARLDSVVIATRPMLSQHSGEHLRQIVESVLDDWCIPKSKIVSCLTDGSANIMNAVRLIHPTSCSLNCFAHTLNVIVQTLMDKVVGFKRLVKDVKSIVTFFKMNKVAAEQLDKEQVTFGREPLKLVQECPNRWNSIYLMIDRYLEIHVFVARAFIELSLELQLPSEQDLQMLVECREILQPIHEVMTEIAAERYLTASKILPMIHCLRGTVETIAVSQEDTLRLKTEMVNLFQEHFLPLESSRLLTVATILDPRFKTRPIASSVMIVEALHEINVELRKVGMIPLAVVDKARTDIAAAAAVAVGVGGQKPVGLWDYLDSLDGGQEILLTSACVSYDKALEKYLRMPPIDRNENPLQYWNVHEYAFPLLRKVAIKFLTIVGSAVPTENVFSKAGSVNARKHNRLDPKRAEKLVFLSSISNRNWDDD